MIDEDARSNNLLAPGLAFELSDEVAAGVAELKRTGARSPYATPDEAVVRREDSPRDVATPQRPAFVRDSEKILHLPSYNRLNGKTQVFSFNANDDITRRGLHVQLVDRIARDIGAALGLNCDLIDAISLGHDMGHTPFGHAGERFLNEIYHERAGRHFLHNVNSVRVLDVLYGRNLSLQTLDGVLCHNGEFEQQVLETGPAEGFAGFDAQVERCWTEGYEAVKRLRPMTLEGCVVRLSDIIAYVGKDRQDAIRAKRVAPEDFDDGLGGAYNAWALTVFSVDVIENSFGKDRIQMSEDAFAELRRAKDENYRKIYDATEVNAGRSAQIGELFREVYERLYDDLERGDERSPIFKHHIADLSAYLAHYGRAYEWERDLDLTVVDFIASMTDDYFMGLCERMFGDRQTVFTSRGYFDGIDPGWCAR